MENINFKQWLEMALVSKETLTIDENDIAFLKQFPMDYWASALSQRYNELIFRSSDAGVLNKDYQDPTVFTFIRGRKADKVIANADMPYVLHKLRRANIDLTGTSAINRESLYYNRMSIKLAQKLVKQLKATISSKKLKIYQDAMSNPKSLIEPKKALAMLDPKPNVVNWTPNYLKSNRNDPELMKDDSPMLQKQFDNMLPLIQTSMNKIINRMILKPSKEGWNPNQIYWRENIKDLQRQLRDAVWLNWKHFPFRNNPDIDRRILDNFIYNKIKTIMQKGVISRRSHQALMNQGYNVANLYNQVHKTTRQPWTSKDIKNVLDTTKDTDERLKMFKSNTMRTPKRR